MIYEFPKQYFGKDNENMTSRRFNVELTGAVVYKETDLGPWVTQHAPGADEDFETFSTLKGESVEKLLIEIIKEYYPSHVEFRAALAKYDIPYEYFCY